MKIQSTAHQFDPKTNIPLTNLVLRKDVVVAVETDLMPNADVITAETLKLSLGTEVVPFTQNKGKKPPAVRIRDGVLSATGSALSFADLGLEAYAESIHENAEAPLDVLLTIVSTGKLISTIDHEGFTSWKTYIDGASVGASAFASLGHIFPQIKPYATVAKLARLFLQSGRDIHEVVLAVKG